MCGSVYNAISRSQKDRVKEIDIHTWSRGGVDSDSVEDDDFGFEKEKIRGKIGGWDGGFRLI
jgi:hypothetical protein